MKKIILLLVFVIVLCNFVLAIDSTNPNDYEFFNKTDTNVINKEYNLTKAKNNGNITCFSNFTGTTTGVGLSALRNLSIGVGQPEIGYQRVDAATNRWWVNNSLKSITNIGYPFYVYYTANLDRKIVYGWEYNSSNSLIHNSNETMRNVGNGLLTLIQTCQGASCSVITYCWNGTRSERPQATSSLTPQILTKYYYNSTLNTTINYTSEGSQACGYYNLSGTNKWITCTGNDLTPTIKVRFDTNATVRMNTVAGNYTDMNSTMDCSVAAAGSDYEATCTAYRSIGSYGDTKQLWLAWCDTSGTLCDDSKTWSVT